MDRAVKQVLLLSISKPFTNMDLVLSHEFNRNGKEIMLYRKTEIFRVVQFSRDFAVGRNPRKLKSAKCFPSLSKVKEIMHKRSRIPFCSSYFLYISQTKKAVYHLRGNHAVTLYEKREKIRYYLRVWHLG